jgi:isocitrate lyase
MRYEHATAEQLNRDWSENPRWRNIKRGYTAEDVIKLRGTVYVEHSLARYGAEKLWRLLHTEPFIGALGALTGNQAVQQVKAGLKAIYLSGWQVAADANEAMTTYPDLSLYPAHSVPKVIERINNALLRADEISHCEDDNSIDWMVPIVADAEAGFGGVLNTFELTKAMIRAGAAGIHLEDQLASAKKCGHMGGKVLVPTQEAVARLVAARLAADIMDVPTVLIARTDAEGATLLTSDIDPRDRPFMTGERTPEGFFRTQAGLEQAVARAVAYAPYADIIWCETSFNWSAHLSESQIAKFQEELAALGYKFQFVTLAGFHTLNYSMFTLAHEYSQRHMAAYAELQNAEFAAEKLGYTATRHQREVGAGYFDLVGATIYGSDSVLQALTGSTEEKQFKVQRAVGGADD